MKHTNKPTEIGTNRTGIEASPKDGEALIRGAREGVPRASFDGKALESLRLDYSREAEPVGTMPPPASLTGAAKAAAKALKGEKSMVFLDFLGERLAFERTGTRLYEALLVKREAGEPRDGGPTRADLEEIRDQELAHTVIVKEAMEKLGGDPTAATPSADIVGVASEGMLKVLVDSRTTLTQALQVILAAELTDNAAWELLVELAEGLDQSDLAERFGDALAEEEEHLAKVRTWWETAVKGQAGVESEAPSAPPPAS